MPNTPSILPFLYSPTLLLQFPKTRGSGGVGNFPILKRRSILTVSVSKNDVWMDI